MPVTRRVALAGGLLSVATALGPVSLRAQARAFRAPVLCYHQFGEHVGSTLMVSRVTLKEQLQLIVARGVSVVPARRLVERWYGRAPALPERSCAVTIDDGYKSIHSIFFPLAMKYRIPATVFIYPSAVSVLPFALTWEQLAEMTASGLIDVQSHSHTHPNLQLEEQRLSGASYDQFVRRELELSRRAIESRLGRPCDQLAWPYGVSDPDLRDDARQAGYVAAFGVARRPATQDDDVMALPRYMVTERNRAASFERLLMAGADAPR
jgi:peptidoglycan/xylan/chitin deacetylase (PgdA/CDA1 family)